MNFNEVDEKELFNRVEEDISKMLAYVVTERYKNLGLSNINYDRILNYHIDSIDDIFESAQFEAAKNYFLKKVAKDVLARMYESGDLNVVELAEAMAKNGGI